VNGREGGGGREEMPSPETEAEGSEPCETLEMALERLPEPSPEDPPRRVVVWEP
jgi:hypothetical protein